MRAAFDDHHVITGIDMRRVDRLVLALEQTGRFGRNASEHFPIRVDHVPLTGHGPGGGNKRIHAIPFDLLCRWRLETKTRPNRRERSDPRVVTIRGVRAGGW